MTVRWDKKQKTELKTSDKAPQSCQNLEPTSSQDKAETKDSEFFLYLTLVTRALYQAQNLPTFLFYLQSRNNSNNISVSR